MVFTKMHGAGNDFIIINNIIEKLPESVFPQLAKKLCAFHSSIGADGMMIVTEPKQGGDYAMLFYNSDGSLGEMCGNGARCIARYGYEKGLAGETQRIESTAGLVVGKRHVQLNEGKDALEAQVGSTTLHGERLGHHKVDIFEVRHIARLLLELCPGQRD